MVNSGLMSLSSCAGGQRVSRELVMLAQTPVLTPQHRLRRICAAVGNESVVFVSCSATIENPADHMRAIFGVDEVEVVNQDGSPTGQKVWPLACTDVVLLLIKLSRRAIRNGSSGTPPGSTRRTSRKVGFPASARRPESSASSWTAASAPSSSAKCARYASCSCARSGWT